MSDSEDDMSMSGSEGGEEDVDMDDGDQDDIVADVDDDGPVSDGDEGEGDGGFDDANEPSSKWFQKEIWQLKKLPYYKDIEAQANETFGNIKAGLGQAVLLNDPQVGIMHWICELERYIEKYGRRFSKEDNILLVKILLKNVKPKCLFRDVKISMHCLNALLCRRDLLIRGDLTIDWHPLFDLYIEVAYKNVEEDGLFLLPDGFKNELNTLIFYARSYFSEDAPQEILDRVRPYMCPWDESTVRAWRLLDLFMPMNFSAAVQATHGAGLWLEEAWHWYSIIENNSIIDGSILKMFARLNYEAPGFVDWSDKLDLIFTKQIRSLRLGGVVGLCQTFSVEQGALFFSYLLGTSCHDKAMSHLRSFYKLIESYVHPSNHGSHSAPITQNIQKFMHSVVLRVKRERREKHLKRKTCNPIPAEMKLSQKHLDEIITMALPCIKLLIFSKSNIDQVVLLLRNTCALAPKIVIPAILDVVYPALETLTEPHRLLQALQALVSAAPCLAKDNVYRIHAITLLNSLLPALDKNDIAKCMVTFQFVGIMVNLIPLVDCSEAVHVRNDLTAEERELCSATANFENIIAMFMDKLLGMLIDHGETSISAGAHGTLNAKSKNNLEDSILHRGTISVFKGIFRNSSTELFKFALDRVYSFVSEHIFDSKVVCDAVGDMIFVANRCYPELAFPRFFKLVYRRLVDAITPEMYTEEKPDFQVMWWLNVAARVVKVPAHTIIEHWSDITKLLELITPFSKCNDAADRSCMVLENILESLCSIYIIDSCRRRKNFDKPLEEYLAIRHWAEPVDKHNWELQWYVPTEEAIAKAEEIFQKYFTPTLLSLMNPEGMNKKDILVRLWRIRHMVSGAGFSIPLFDGPILGLLDSFPLAQKFRGIEHPVCAPKGIPVLRLGGKNIRDMLLDCLENLLNYICNHAEDDVKSISEIITLLNGLENFRGISRDVYNQSVQNYKVTKIILSDKISGNRANVEMICEDYVYLQHKMRVSSLCGYRFHEQNARIIKMLIKLATSYYSQTRIKAQQVALNMIKEHPYSYKRFLDEILVHLDPARNPTHEQMKGALHLLIEGRRHALVMRCSFEAQMAMWSSIIVMKHSEKPSIIHLLETAQNTIVDGYESYRVKYEIDREMKELAQELFVVREGCPVNATKPLPDNQIMEQHKDNLANLEKIWKNGYYQLWEKLLELSVLPELHWRQVDMAQALMSLLVRRDMPMPSQVLRSFMRLLIHDSIKTRKMATAVVASWLRINKPKAVKHELVVDKPDHVSPGAKWPIQYGFRDDNRCMLYEEEKLPTTDEEWDNFQFCGKQHWGFYTWPERLKTYAPLSQQTFIDRQEEDLSPDEKFILDTLRDPEYAQKLKAYFTVEEKKGDDLFNAVNFTFFQGLARNFNDLISDVFKDHLEVLIPSTREADHRLAAEMIGGIINGSKLWKHARQRHMWTWLGPLLTRALENVKDDNMRNWGVSLATVCGSAEARMLKPLIDILWSLLNRPTDSAFVANARLFLVQGSLCQFEWRATQLWNRFVESLQPILVQNYNNLRERVAVCLVSAAYYDLPTVYRSPNYPQYLLPPNSLEMMSAYSVNLGPCWDEMRLCTVEGVENESEVKKQSRLAMKGVISFCTNMTLSTFVAVIQPVITALPLFCHYSNDVGDEELQKSCTRFTKDLLQAVYINPDNSEAVVEVAQQILSSQQCWWKSKVALLGMIRSLIVSNVYAFAPHKERIGLMLCDSFCDGQIAVREAAAMAFSNLVLSGFFDITSALMERFNTACASDDVIFRHGGVLGLSAIVLASPYTVPSYLPDVLMKICRCASQPNPIKDTVKRTLSEFKRTHLDSWREHEAHFNEDQLAVLRDLLISPNYYV